MPIGDRVAIAALADAHTAGRGAISSSWPSGDRHVAEQAIIFVVNTAGGEQSVGVRTATAELVVPINADGDNGSTITDYIPLTRDFDAGYTPTEKDLVPVSFQPTLTAFSQSEDFWSRFGSGRRRTPGG